MMQSGKRVLLTVAVAVALVAAACLTLYLKSVAEYKQAVGEMVVQPVDMAAVADGVYVGECDVRFIYAKVKVTVRDHVITGIELLEHKNDRGQAAEPVLEQIVAQQKIDVDTVAGATNSSVVLQKAVANALAQ